MNDDGNDRELPYEKLQLSSGLTLLFWHEAALPKYSGDLYLVVKVGNLKEKDEEYGFSHLLEHLLVRATLEDRDNLFTNTFKLCEYHETFEDHTNFGFHVDDQHQMSLVLSMLANIAIKANLRKKHLGLERDIISIENIGDIEEDPPSLRSMIWN